MKIIKDIKLKVDEEEVLRYQGYSRNKIKEPNGVILQINQEEIERGYNLFNPQGIYYPVKVKEISFIEEKIDFEKNLFLHFNASIINLLKGIDHLVFGIVTIGNALEEKVSELFTQGEYSRAIALDAVGTTAVEDLSRYLRNFTCQEAKNQNLQVTRHFSPGYSGWDIEEQKNIFKIVPAQKIKVSLTDSCMMIPKKSLSWVIGVGEKIIDSTKEDDICQTCPAINCQYRKNI